MFVSRSFVLIEDVKAYPIIEKSVSNTNEVNENFERFCNSKYGSTVHVFPYLV